MKKTFSIKRIAMATILAMAILIINTACSSSGNEVTIDARFLNMNQANFYVYSPDGAIEGIDTITVQGGRFTYEKEILTDGTLVIIFPNFATIPVFVTPGDDISIEANAANLKGIKVTGTDVNKAFTAWRENCNSLSPEEMKKHAKLFIEDNPASPISRWLLRQYFVTCQKPDLKTARRLVSNMLKATDNNIHVSRLAAEINSIGMLKIGDRLPKINAKDIDGKPILNGPLLKGRTIIHVWTTWNYESQNILRMLANHNERFKDEKKFDNIITICLDPSTKQCRNTLKQCYAENLTTICDTMLWDSPLLKSLGINGIPDNIKLNDGKIVALHVPFEEMTK